ncbi:carboxypeptidase-like regulatory domain-containing protein [Carboxylicivirga sp. N1Y90]|uniref:carboxypeptidase-like regulatory domain-containing protein n=1 Tax=Carboxylicivirga fragile TaxID=3417571 RepID=UPI003D341EE0|nr:carboxypeptidase-like regulatory domain-containing protein [Marinilabiliaceae bacterium N1Y90]
MTKKIKLVYLFILFSSFISLLHAQEELVIAGQITEKDSLPIAGTSVVLKGASIGTVSNFDGRYNISIDNKMDTIVLQYSFIGFRVKEVTLIRDQNDPKKFYIKKEKNVKR